MERLAIEVVMSMVVGGLMVSMVSNPLTVTGWHFVSLGVTWAIVIVNGFNIIDKMEGK